MAGPSEDTGLDTNNDNFLNFYRLGSEQDFEGNVENDRNDFPRLHNTGIDDFEYFCNAMTITSNGLVIQITKEFGEYFFIPSLTCFIIFKFIPNKSSLLIPGYLGTPAVIIITSESLMSS